MVASIVPVFSMMSVTPEARIIEARVSRLASAVMTMAIESMIVISSVPSIPFPMMTVAPRMLVSAFVFRVGDRGQRRKHQSHPRKSR
jgi:hypothetical protein